MRLDHTNRRSALMPERVLFNGVDALGFAELFRLLLRTPAYEQVYRTAPSKREACVWCCL